MERLSFHGTGLSVYKKDANIGADQIILREMAVVFNAQNREKATAYNQNSVTQAAQLGVAWFWRFLYYS